MGEDTFKAAVWYNGKIVNGDGNNPRYVGGMVKFINVDQDTKLEVFRGTVRDISGIPEAVPITLKYHIFISSEISKLLDITPYETLKFMLQPDLMLHTFYVEENVVEDVTDTISNMPRCRRSARNSNTIQMPPTGVETRSNKRSAGDRDDPVKAPKVGDSVGGTSSKNSSKVRIFIRSICGKLKPLDVEMTETIGSIKKRILKIEGTAVRNQRLLYDGMALKEDHVTVASLDIDEGSTIDILQCMGC
ncbi:hypothetical protein C5167_016064 [Papaver somniferum]|uniref:uncharacterized protein LOC113332612 n=1 Tax=Papaver somniferum TaxID=3469 RepID=UPI000E6F5365|nr:uncharacterized protein LOC113332612 [Papaver somniferum]RZC88258.1 hypothetical protein C5167_016064 [Papaver somniferum]